MLFRSVENWECEGKVYVADQTCAECERLWDAYEQAIQSQRIIEGRYGIEIGLEVLVRKASNRREEATLEYHETTHVTVTATASGAA